MQRRDKLGEMTNIWRCKSRRRQSSASSTSDVFVFGTASEGHSDLSVSGMKLRSEKNLGGDEGRNAEAWAANVTPTDPFEKGEQTLIRPDHHHHEDLEELGDDFEGEGIEKPQRTSERYEANAGEELLFTGTSKSETKSTSRRKEQSFLVKQGKNAMMSSINPKEEQSS